MSKIFEFWDIKINGRMWSITVVCMVLSVATYVAWNFPNDSHRDFRQNFIARMEMAVVDSDTTSFPNVGLIKSLNKPKLIVVDKMKDHFVVTQQFGRLGNQLFELANLIAFARSSNLTAAVYSDQFVSTRADFELKGLTVLDHSVSPTYDAEYRCLCNQQGRMLLKRVTATAASSVVLMDACRNTGCFYDHDDAVRKELSFEDSVMNECTQKFYQQKSTVEHSSTTSYESENPTKIITIGIHTRRGDIINGIFSRSPTSKHFVSKAIDYVLNHGKGINGVDISQILFVMFGDERSWNLEFVDWYYSSKNATPITIGKRHPIIKVPEASSPSVDMCQLSLCDKIIMTTGTSFAWWAAYLGGRGKEIFYPKYYFEKGSKKMMLSQDNYMMPYWTMIE